MVVEGVICFDVFDCYLELFGVWCIGVVGIEGED